MNTTPFSVIVIIIYRHQYVPWRREDTQFFNIMGRWGGLSASMKTRVGRGGGVGRSSVYRSRKRGQSVRYLFSHSVELLHDAAGEVSRFKTPLIPINTIKILHDPFSYGYLCRRDRSVAKKQGTKVVASSTNRVIRVAIDRPNRGRMSSQTHDSQTSQQE